MLKRNIAILIAGGLLGAQANLAGAGDSNVSIFPAQLKYLEARAASIRAETQGAVDETVKINASTQYVNAKHLQTLKIENNKGQSFTWNADTLGDIPLSVIAPRGFAAGETRVHIHHPTEHLGG